MAIRPCIIGMWKLALFELYAMQSQMIDVTVVCYVYMKYIYPHIYTLNWMKYTFIAMKVSQKKHSGILNISARA